LHDARSNADYPISSGYIVENSDDFRKLGYYSECKIGDKDSDSALGI